MTFQQFIEQAQIGTSLLLIATFLGLIALYMRKGDGSKRH